MPAANLVSCWLTFDDVDLHNGAMQFIPGSHLRPMIHDQAQGSDVLLDMGKLVDDSQAVVADLPAGGITLHHCQTLHRTAPNTTDRQRRALAIHYHDARHQVRTHQRNDRSVIQPPHVAHARLTRRKRLDETVGKTNKVTRTLKSQ